MSADAIKTVAVLGAGTMGNGIAHVFERSGLQSDPARRRKALPRPRHRNHHEKSLIAKNKKSKISEADKPAVLARIRPIATISALAAADFAVEAVPEQLDLKVRLLKDVDAVLKPAPSSPATTSSISITQLATQTKRPERCCRHALP